VITITKKISYTKDLAIKKVLIANRSEIASRIIDTCRIRGMKTVAVYSNEDKYAPYVYEADESYALSKSGIEGYLNEQELIEIAKQAHADAIHPGYGFLAENASFAQKVIDCGITWIGPHPQAIQLMGHKHHARELMKTAGVPTLPGMHVKGNNKEEALKSATHIGFPVLLKASCGGGGKAMRLVKHEEDFMQQWNAVVSEAQNFFHSDEILIEKYMSHARHVEVQIAGDGKQYIHLYERECSIQRRHQKIIEETPCSFISQSGREKRFL